jgi:uncharacterized protein YndB with AHSA1/START domain
MPKIERTMTVQKPLDQVWAYLTDFTNTEEWDPPTVSTTRISGDGGVGTVYRNVSKILGREVEIEYTVVDLEPRSVLRLRGTTSSMEMLDTIRFAESPDGVTVTYTAEFDPQGAAKLVEPLLPLGL